MYNNKFCPGEGKDHAEDLAAISANLKRLRKQFDLTQAEVARLAGCCLTVYGRYERGLQPVPIDILYRLADVYNCDVAELFKSSSAPSP